MRPTAEQLTGVPLFESLSPEQVQAVATLSELREEDAGTRLVGEGAPGFSLFVILEGTAAVMAGTRLLSPLAAGDFFGEIALLGEGRRTSTVMATSQITLSVMYGSDFRVFERDFPEASSMMRAAMTERLARGSSPAAG